MRLSERLEQKIPIRFTPPSSAQAVYAAIRKIHERWPDITINISNADLEKLIQEMLRHLETDDWKDVKVSFVIKVAYALFLSDNRNRQDLSALRQFYYDEIKVSDRQSLLNAFFKIYLESFEQDGEHTRLLSEALDMSRHALGMKWQILLEHVPDILNPASAPQALADKMMDMADIYQELKALGIYNPHMAGLLNEAHLLFVSEVAKFLDQPDEMARMINWLKPKGREAKQVGAAQAITALINVWRGRSPSKDDIGYLTTNLVSLYGDPRVKHTAVWGQVPAEALKVFYRWLAGNDIRFFLEVVSRAEMSAEDGYMWEPRKKFWLGLFDEGRIDDAWVAFSKDGEREARRIRQSVQGQTNIQYARQTAGGNRDKTSLLIMHIGRKIVVEGSHSYKVYIFNDTDQRAPQMHQSHYDCDEIRYRKLYDGIPHIGNWQQKVLLNI